MRVLETQAMRFQTDGEELGNLAAQMCSVIDRSQKLSAADLEKVRLQIIEAICEAGYPDDLREYRIIEAAATKSAPMHVPSMRERDELSNKLRAAINAYCEPAEEAA